MHCIEHNRHTERALIVFQVFGISRLITNFGKKLNTVKLKLLVQWIHKASDTIKNIEKITYFNLISSNRNET